MTDRSLADIESVLASALHRERLTVIDIGRLLTEAKRNRSKLSVRLPRTSPTCSMSRLTMTS
jgi:hypothetical protein